MKSINDLKGIKKEISSLKWLGIAFGIGMAFSGIFFYMYELGRMITVIFGFMFVGSLITMRYWCTKQYITRMFNELNKKK